MYVSQGPWRLENALVTELDVDPLKGEVLQNTLRLTGFGASYPLPTYRKFIFDQMSKSLAALYQDVSIIANTGSVAFIDRRGVYKALLFAWEFYPGLTAPGLTAKPWFVFLPRTAPGTRGGPWPDVATMAKSLPLTFVPGLAGAATNPPGLNGLPTTITADTFDKNATKTGTLTLSLVDGSGAFAGVLYPLFVPFVNNRQVDWPTFFSMRAANPSLTGSLQKPLQDGQNVPGLLLRGAQFPIEVLQPTVRP
jgi:hypothetical protein